MDLRPKWKVKLFFQGEEPETVWWLDLTDPDPDRPLGYATLHWADDYSVSWFHSSHFALKIWHIKVLAKVRLHRLLRHGVCRLTNVVSSEITYHIANHCQFANLNTYLILSHWNKHNIAETSLFSLHLRSIML